MRHYRVTEELRQEVNRFLGTEYLKPKDVGGEIYRLENYEGITQVSPEKARLLMATLFPEEVSNYSYISSHREEIADLGRKLHVEKPLRREVDLAQYLVRREGLPEYEEPWKENHYGIDYFIRLFW